jgi:hypothetical protein
MTNTDRLIALLEIAERAGANATIRFNVGRFTGNSPSVIAALRRRGFTVNSGADGGWILSRG